jgi:hypothetical protein
MSPVRTRSQEALDQATEEARDLEMAQALVEEAEIGRHLPREVININKKLERQQQSVDLLQGNISTLTDMVAQLGLSLNSLGSARSRGTMVHEPGGVEFSTPPHHHTVLSPILEGQTPTDSAGPLNAPKSTDFSHFDSTSDKPSPKPTPSTQFSLGTADK